MDIFELKIWDDEGRKCTFYSVLPDGERATLTDNFLERFEHHPQCEVAIQELVVLLLDSIGNRHGAKEDFFNRSENEVAGLPLQGRIMIDEVRYHFPHFPLRLYALRLSEGVVILFGGGIKDGTTNQTSTLHIPWMSACRYAKRIINALSAGEIRLDSSRRKLLNHLGNEEILL